MSFSFDELAGRMQPVGAGRSWIPGGRVRTPGRWSDMFTSSSSIYELCELWAFLQKKERADHWPPFRRDFSSSPRPSSSQAPKQ